MNIVKERIIEFATRLSKELDLRMSTFGEKRDKCCLTEWNDVYGYSTVDITIAPIDKESAEEMNMTPSGSFGDFEDCDEEAQVMVKEACENNLPLVWVGLAILDSRLEEDCGKYIIRPLSELSEAWVFDGIKKWLDEQRANRIDEKYPYLAETLNMINRIGYDSVNCGPNGDCIVVRINGKYGLISMHGEPLCELKYDMIYAATNGELMRVEINGKYGYINSKGKEIIPLVYDDAIEDISDGRAAVCLSGKWGFVTLDNKVVIPFEYDEVGEFGCGLANIKKGDKWGYINEQNDLIIACKYDCCETFRNSKATVWLDWECSTIDTEGNTVECDNEDGLPF